MKRTELKSLSYDIKAAPFVTLQRFSLLIPLPFESPIAVVVMSSEIETHSIEWTKLKLLPVTLSKQLPLSHRNPFNFFTVMAGVVASLFFSALAIPRTPVFVARIESR